MVWFCLNVFVRCCLEFKVFVGTVSIEGFWMLFGGDKFGNVMFS